MLLFSINVWQTCGKIYLEVWCECRKGTCIRQKWFNNDSLSGHNFDNRDRRTRKLTRAIF